MNSKLYIGRVVHRRFRPKRHMLSYRVFSLLLDLDELAELDLRLRLFGLDRWWPVAFHAKDHGDGRADLRSYVEEVLRDSGLDFRPDRIALLCYPRLFGYAFNPLSVYYCYDEDGEVRAVLYEVNNTFGERHSYLIPADGDARGRVRQRCRKRFYVSPFMEVEGDYDFELILPGDRVKVGVDLSRNGDLMLRASFTGLAEPLNDGKIVKAVIRLPFMAVKVMTGIHWEALKLWLKRIPITRKPPPPVEPVSATLVDRRKLDEAA